MPVDFRTRRDEDAVAVDPGAFFARELPEKLARHGESIAPGAVRLGLRPLAVEVDGGSWSLACDDGAVAVREGMVSGAARLRLNPDELTDLVHDRATPMTFFTGGTLDMPVGGLGDCLDWWLVLRAALDAQPIHTPGAVRFRDRSGAALDLGRSFSAEDDPDEVSHFLHEAGFLHLRGMFTTDEMAQIAADMNAAAASYADGDGNSWWATTGDGTRRLVRMQAFDRHSATAAAILRNERFLAIGEIPGDGHVHAGLEGNAVEALIKPIGVTKGISDLPWHKDCSLGRHSYECCSLTVGVSITGAGPTSGQLRVVAGSHRALLRPALVEPGSHGLPELELPTETGDVTVHLSCTLHMSQPPKERERRVLYTSFRLPAEKTAAMLAAQRRLRAVRERSHTTVSQEPA